MTYSKQLIKLFSGLLFVSYCIAIPPSLAEPKVTASAAFDIDSNNVVRGAAVSAAIGENDAFSRAFFDDSSGTPILSSVAVGSSDTIQCTPITSCGTGAVGNVDIGSSSGTNPINTDRTPITIQSEP
jgi:hypothetical protein